MSRKKRLIAKPVFRITSEFGLFVLLGVIGLAAVYGRALAADFTFDSPVVILQDPRIQSWSADNLWAIFSQDYWYPNFLGLYRPLTTLTFSWNYQTWGPPNWALDYRLYNLVLHGLNTLWVAYLLHSAFGLEKLFARWGALLFALHPVMVEVVTNLVGRSDLLAFFFVMSGWVLHRAARDCGFHGWMRSVTLVLLALSAVCGVLSKESAAVLVGVMGLDDLLLRRGGASIPNVDGHPGFSHWRWLGSRLFLPGYAAALGAFGLVMVWRWWLYHEIPLPPVSFTDNPLVGQSLVVWQVNAWGILLRYIGLLFWPGRLSVDYSFDALPLAAFPPVSPQDFGVAVAALLMVCAVVVALVGLKRWPRLAFCWLFFWGTLLPASNIIKPVASIIGERFLYLPSIGWCAAMAWGVQVAWERLKTGKAFRYRPVLCVALGFLVLAGVPTALGTRTYLRNLDWQDNITLFRAATRDVPNSSRSHSALATSLYFQALEDKALASRMDEIIYHATVSRAIMDRLPPERRNAKVYYDLATYLVLQAGLLEREQPAQASALLEQAEGVAKGIWDLASPSLATNKAAPVVEMSHGRTASPSTDVPFRAAQLLGGIRLNRNKPAEALQILDEALSLNPTAAQVYLLRAEAFGLLGRTEEAVVSSIQCLVLGNAQVRGNAWPVVEKLYQSLRPPVDGVVRAVEGPRLNTALEPVRLHLRTAILQVYERLLAKGRVSDAESFLESGRKLLGGDPLLSPQ